MLIVRIILAVLTLTIVTGHAIAFCSKPDAPYCATQYGEFENTDDFDRCKIEMDNYKSEVEDFLSCLRRDSDEAISDYNDAVNSFNRRART